MMRKLRASVFLFCVLSLSGVPAQLLANESAAPATSPARTFEELKAGNQRFIDGKAEHSLADPVRRKELATEQHPKAIVLSCSDSRVPPELVFDKGLGELFTVRVAGNVLGAATVASIEYAVEHLGARLVVILGHESCGAVKAAISTPLGQSAGSPDLDSLISTLKPNLREVSRDIASDDKTLRKPVMANVDAVGSRLLQRSRIVRKHVEEGKLAIVYGIYGLESGKVDFWHVEALNPK
jgi:carbonic anhydrase